MAPRALRLLLATPLLTGVAALRSKQPTELAAADLDERTDMPLEDEAPLELEWEVSRIIQKLRPPRQSSNYALQRSSSTLDTDGTTPNSWIFGSHHKAGTDLMRWVGLTQANALNQSACLSYGKYGWRPEVCWAHPKDFHVFFDHNLTAARAHGGFGQKKLGRNYRVVHIMRDPLAMVVSGYIYHSSNDDTPPVLKIERNQSMPDGLVTESNYVLSKTGMEMMKTYQATRNDPHVLHVRFEDFTRSTDDFDHISRKIYNFTVGKLDKGRENMEKMVQALSVQDLNRHPKKNSKHVANQADETKVKAALQSIDPAVMDKLEQARAALDY